jgi:integrase
VDVAVVLEVARRVRARYPDTPASELARFPRTTRNREGKRPVTDSVVAPHHRSWVDSLPALSLEDGRDFGKAAVFLYAYRHSFAQRHADAGTPVDVLKDLMGHRSMSTTQWPGAFLMAAKVDLDSRRPQEALPGWHLPVAGTAGNVP